ncbi:MAG: thioredoxin family protein [Ignavibacteria bacterium]|nr:thioredoxin family protein [Ignavibacteria bacterium]
MSIVEHNILNVLLITSDNCEECDVLETKLRRFAKKMLCFKLSVLKTNDFNLKEKIKIFITPALIINGKLQFYGDVLENKLKEILYKQIKIKQKGTEK